MHCQLPIHILLAKSDKLKSGAQKRTLREVQSVIDSFEADISVQLFSSQDRTGLDTARHKLDEWFCGEAE